MTRRSKDWNEGLARDLRKPAFACEFLLAAVEDGIPLQQALGKEAGTDVTISQTV
jgi:hypothetical protein